LRNKIDWMEFLELIARQRWMVETSLFTNWSLEASRFKR